MNAGDDRTARRRQQTAARRKSGRGAAQRSRRKRQRTIKRLTAASLVVVLAGGIVAVIVSSGGGDEPPAEASHDIAVVADDFDYTPNRMLGLAGEINITMTNTGLVGHNLIVLEQGVRISSATQFDESTELGRIESLAPGFDASLSLDLEPGTYQVVCLIPNHLEQGSTADLIVS